MKFSSVILAAGSGNRFDNFMNKTITNLHGKNVVDYSVQFFKSIPECNEIILVVSKDNFNFFSELYSNTNIKIIFGGETRQKSVYNSLKYINNDYVAIHDGARPIISNEFINYFVENYSKFSAFCIGNYPKNTIHTLKNGVLRSNLTRNELISVFTPQIFQVKLILDVHRKAIKDQTEMTDDLGLLLKYSNVNPYVFISEDDNIKLTTRKDLKILEVLLDEDR